MLLGGRCWNGTGVVVAVVVSRGGPFGYRCVDEDIASVEECIIEVGDLLEYDSGDVQVVSRSIDDLVDDHGKDGMVVLGIGDVDSPAACTIESSIGIPDGRNVLLGRIGVAAAAGIRSVVPEGHAEITESLFGMGLGADGSRGYQASEGGGECEFTEHSVEGVAGTGVAKHTSMICHV